jgi:hypothetical protein
MFSKVNLVFIVTLILSACSGGMSGIMSSSGFGKWLIYEVSYQSEVEKKLEQPFEKIIEDMLVNLGFEMDSDWGEPILTNAQVAKFKQKYKGRPISLDVEISQKKIILMSTSYCNETKEVFDNIESGLSELFTEANVERYFSTKDIYGHSCIHKR